MAEARRFVCSALSHRRQDLVEVAGLLASELATNAVVHAHSSFDVSISESEDHIRIAVSDKAPEMPAFLSVGPDDEHGRGLHLLNQLSSDWGVVERRLGKTIWFDLKCDHVGAPCPPSHDG